MATTAASMSRPGHRMAAAATGMSRPGHRMAAAATGMNGPDIRIAAAATGMNGPDIRMAAAAGMNRTNVTSSGGGTGPCIPASRSPLTQIASEAMRTSHTGESTGSQGRQPKNPPAEG